MEMMKCLTFFRFCWEATRRDDISAWKGLWTHPSGIRYRQNCKTQWNASWHFIQVIVATSDTHTTHTHIDGVGVKKPFKPNEGVMMEWEWLLQLVIVIVKPLTVSLYSYHEIIDRDGRGESQQTQNEKKNPPQKLLLCNYDSVNISIFL